MQQTHDTPKELMDIFELSAADLKILAEEFCPEFARDIDQVKRDIGLWLAKAAGLPCGEYHQQPYDLVRMFPISLSPDECGSPEEFEGVAFIFYLWAYKFREILKSIAFDEAIRQIKTISVAIAYHYGDANNTRRWIELTEALRWIRWFRCTEGCFDQDSGALVDSDTAVLREFIATWGRA